MPALKGVLHRAAAELQSSGIETPALDARLLLRHALGMSQEALLAAPERALTAAEEAAFSALLARRLAREPMSHLLGVREFWGREFIVTPATLTPRPDTETLVEAALAYAGCQMLENRCQEKSSNIHPPASGIQILDLGTGTGCLLLTLLSELPGARGTGVDVSGAALAVARENAVRLQLSERAEFLQGSWCAPLAQRKYQIVVANPPYIASNAISALMPEVAEYEPHLALDGGMDGLACYRAIAQALPPHLAEQAIIVVEAGIGQHEAVAGIFEKESFRVEAVKPDLAGVPRCVVCSFN